MMSFIFRDGENKVWRLKCLGPGQNCWEEDFMCVRTLQIGNFFFPMEFHIGKSRSLVVLDLGDPMNKCMLLIRSKVCQQSNMEFLIFG